MRRLAAVIAFLFAPTVVLSLTPLRPAAVLVFVGMIPALVALLHGRKFAIFTAVGTGLLVALVEWANPYPIAATILMVVVGLTIGALVLRGWHSVATVAGGWPAMLLVSAPISFPGFAGPTASVLITALLALIGGLWATLAGGFLKDLPPAETTPLSRDTALVYGGALAVLLGASAYAATTWAHGSTAGWVLLTILVIARPGLSETWRRIVTRSLGTVAGGVAAAVFAWALPHRPILIAAGAVSLVAAIVLQLKKGNYAIYAFALTAAIVLLSSRDADVFATDLQRVAFTVLGALLTAGLTALIELLLSRRPSAPSRPAGDFG